MDAEDNTNIDTSGFYKVDSHNNFLFGPNFVHTADYQLARETKDSNSYPVYGWYWFDSEDLARQFFNLPAPTL